MPARKSSARSSKAKPKRAAKSKRAAKQRNVPRASKQPTAIRPAPSMLPKREATLAPPAAACAACGASDGRRLLTRSARGLVNLAAICEECVAELARELRPNPALERAQPSAAEPGMLVPAPAEICGWQKFRLEGKKLEWRAERTLVQAARPAVLVHVRLPNKNRQITLTMHPGTEPTRDDAERAGQWLLAPPAEDPELSAGPEAFGPLGSLAAWQPLKVDGQRLEWSAERAYVYEATPYVQIEVREYRSSTRATTYLDWRTQPTLDDAIAAARELWGSDGSS